MSTKDFIYISMIALLCGLLYSSLKRNEKKEQLKPTLEELRYQNECLQIELIIKENKKLIRQLDSIR